MPGRNQRYAQNMSGVSAKLAYVAWTRYMNQIRLKRLEHAGKNALISPKREVMSLPSIYKKRQPPPLEFKAADPVYVFGFGLSAIARAHAQKRKAPFTRVFDEALAGQSHAIDLVIRIRHERNARLCIQDQAPS
jgi:hypothetical protein